MRTLSESRMLEIGTSGLMSGERKRSRRSFRRVPRLSSTLRMEADAASAEWLAIKAIIDAPMPGRRQNEAMSDFDRMRQEMGLPPRAQ